MATIEPCELNTADFSMKWSVESSQIEWLKGPVQDLVYDVTQLLWYSNSVLSAQLVISLSLCRAIDQCCLNDPLDCIVELELFEIHVIACRRVLS